MNNELLHRYKLLRHKFGVNSAIIDIMNAIRLENELRKNDMLVGIPQEIVNSKISTNIDSTEVSNKSVEIDNKSYKIDIEPSEKSYKNYTEPSEKSNNIDIELSEINTETDETNNESEKIDIGQQVNIKEQSSIKTIVAFIFNNEEERNKLKKTITDTNDLFSDIEILVINNDTNCTSENMQKELKEYSKTSVIDAVNLLK